MLDDPLQYIGTTILMLHKFPQIYRAYKARNYLMGFSITKFAGGVIGGTIMLAWALRSGNWGIAALNAIHVGHEFSILLLLLRLKFKQRGQKSIDYLDYFKRLF